MKGPGAYEKTHSSLGCGTSFILHCHNKVEHPYEHTPMPMTLAKPMLNTDLFSASNSIFVQNMSAMKKDDNR